MYLRLGLLLGLSFAADTAHAADKPMSIADYVRQPSYGDMSLSPDGRFLAARVPFEGGRALVVLSRSELEVTATIKGGRKTYVEDHVWIAPQRVAAHMSMEMDSYSQRGWLGGFYAIDADGGNRKEAWGIWFDRLKTPDRVVVGWCADWYCDSLQAAIVQPNKLNSMKGAINLPEWHYDLVSSPDGLPWLSWGQREENDERQDVQLRRDGRRHGEWSVFYDEAKSGVAKTPMRIGNDGTAWFASETKSGPSMIERVDLGTGKFTPVLRHERVSPDQTIWSADGRTLVGAWFHDGRPEAMFVDPDAPEAQITDALGRAFPDAWPRIVSWTDDGKLVLVLVSSDRDPGRYYLYDVGTKKISFLAAASPWIDPAKMAPTQPFRLKARDGTELAGLLTLPRTGKAPFPLVVMPHGGPMVRDYWAEFDGNAQLLASRGIAVLKVDFRGSAGYGRAFEKLSRRQWGRAMQDDLTDATRWAVAQGHADDKRICLYGASYGGYAALMGLVREPELYRCAIGVAGIYDLEVWRQWGDTNDSKIGRKYLDEALGTDPTELARFSPTRRAGEIRGSVLLAHGYRDERASPEHYRRMVQALEKAGVRHETFLRSSEGHGFFDEKDRVAFAEQVLAFLERSWASPPAAKPTGP